MLVLVNFGNFYGIPNLDVLAKLSAKPRDYLLPRPLAVIITKIQLILKNRIKNLFKKNLYPELIKAGGLSFGLNNAFKVIDSTLRTKVDHGEELPFAYCRVHKNHKFSQIYIAAEKKLYLSDYWKNGVCFANGETGNIIDLAESIDFWINNDITTKTLAMKFEFIRPSESSEAFDNGNELEFAWNRLLESGFDSLMKFIELAIEDDTVSKLFPFTSLYTLCFSRSTGYPYESDDLPGVTPKMDSWTLPNKTAKKDLQKEFPGDETIYIVTKNKSEYLGEGNAADALELVKRNLPKN